MSEAYIEFNLAHRWFEAFYKGEKCWEGRPANHKKASKLKVGDSVRLRHANGSMVGVVAEIRPFTTFKEALETLPLGEVLPGIATVDEGIEVYREWYATEIDEDHPALMFRIEFDTTEEYP